MNGLPCAIFAWRMSDSPKKRYYSKELFPEYAAPASKYGKKRKQRKK